MLEIHNIRKITTAIQDEVYESKYKICLNKELTIPAHKTINFDTGLEFTLTEDYDELFLKGEKLDDETMTFFESEMFVKCENQKLMMQITNPSSKDITFNKDFVIGKLYKIFSDNNVVDMSFANGIHIYSDDNISIKSLDKKTRNFVLEKLPDGHRRLIVDID